MPKTSTSFKKGNVPISPGRPKLPEEIKAISRETKPHIIAAYYKLSTMPIEDVKQYVPENMIEAGIARCLADFATSGRTDHIRHIWAECHGKPVESVDANISLDKIIIRRIKADGN
jgi:hypothetical protein